MMQIATLPEARLYCREHAIRPRRDENGAVLLDGPAGFRVPSGLVKTLSTYDGDFTELIRPTNAHIWTAKITRLSDVQPEQVQHLWPGRIPLGKVTVADGDPGLGKTTLLLDVGARVSTGRPMPDGTLSDLDGPAGVVILTAEDGLADTIRPRLDAAGADTTRVVALECLVNGDEERSISLDNLDAIEEAIQTVDARMVIIDPLMAFLSGETNSYRDQDMRRILAPLARLAERTGAAIVVIRHLSKGGGTNAVYRGGGSIGIIGAARCGLLVAPDPDDATGERRILAVTKSNLSALPPALAFTLQPAANGTAYVAWEGATSHTAKQLLALPEDEEDRGAGAEAQDFLRTELQHGPRPADEIVKAAKAINISERTLKRAKKAANVVSEKSGMTGGWTWRLGLDAGTENAEGCHEDTKGATQNGWHPSEKVGTLRAEPESDQVVCLRWLARETTTMTGAEIASARRLLDFPEGTFSDLPDWRDRLAMLCNTQEGN